MENVIPTDMSSAKLPRFFPRATSNWLSGWYDWLDPESGMDWKDVHAEMVRLAVTDSDAAMAFQRNIFGYLNAARALALQECLEIVRVDGQEAENKIDALLNAVLNPEEDNG